MSWVLAIGATVFAAIAQVTIAPLFPLSAAVFDFTLLSLVAIAFVLGPRQAMVAVPVAAILTGFLTDRAPALLLFGYLPLLPLAFLMEGVELPLGRFARLMAAAVATGAWTRLILALSAFAHGAEFAAIPLLRDILIPGLALDALLVSVLYLPSRLVGWTPKSLALRRQGWL